MKVTIKLAALSVLAIALLAGQALATDIAVANYSFEQGDDGHTAMGGWTLPGWDLGFNGGLGGKYDISSWDGLTPATDGKCAFFYNGSFEITQTTAGIIQEGLTYTLNVDLAQKSNFDDTWSTFALAMYAKDTTSGALTYLGGQLFYIDAVPQGGWYTATYAYHATDPTVAGKNLFIKLENPGGLQPWVDNVRLSDNAVPEPGTLAALCSGLLGLAGLVRKRR